MSMQSNSTAHAILGLLSIEPMSGYDMRQWIEQSIGNFWSESYGQIYPSLKLLKAAGLIAEKSGAGGGKKAKRGRERRVYELTAKGQGQLERWLAEPATRSVPRNELLLKLFFGKHMGLEDAAQHVRAFREMHEGILERYERVGRSIGGCEAEQVEPVDRAYWRMTLNYGLHYSRAMVAWCNETLAELERMGRAEILKKTGRKTKAS